MLLALEEEELLKLNFFGTAGVSTVDSKEHLYRAYSFQEQGVAAGDINPYLNTVFGVKAELIISDELSLTAQSNSVSNGSDRINSSVDWAYLKYETPYDLAIRAGLFPLPLFSTSELTYVGYARTYVRPALPFYRVTGLEDFSGLDFIYSTYYGYYDITLRASYGKSVATLPDMANGTKVESKTDNLKIVSIKAENDYISIGLTYFNNTGELTLTDPNTHISGKIEGELEFFSLEFKADYKNIIIEGGVVSGRIDSSLPDESSGYVSFAYPVDEFTPYYLYSTRILDPKENPFGPPGSTAEENQQKTHSLGLRYDIYQGVALKAQFDRFDLKAGTPALAIATQASDKEAVHAISFTVDVAF